VVSQTAVKNMQNKGRTNRSENEWLNCLSTTASSYVLIVNLVRSSKTNIYTYWLLSKTEAELKKDKYGP